MTTTETTSEAAVTPREFSATFTKLRNGAWGIRVHGPVATGDVVTVSKRDGSTDVVQVGRVVWTDGRSATIAGFSRGAGSTSGRSSSRRRSAPRRFQSEDEYESYADSMASAKYEEMAYGRD